MKQIIEQQLLDRYGNSGPRYTSYPTVKQFHNGFNQLHFKAMAKETNEDLIPRPLSLYLHIPFCEKICFYCACNKIVTANKQKASVYLEYLKREIMMQSSLFDKDRTVEQLHFGGGTPTYLNYQQLSDLISFISEHFNLRNDDRGDFSIEIDPRQMTDISVQQLRDLGFNRMSIGVQDVDEKVQIAVNRIQPIAQTADIVHQAKQCGFKSINLDLIYGLPEQTVQSFSKTLDAVINMQPDRIAIYNYAHLPEIFKPQRQINSEKLPSAEGRLQIFNTALNILNASGYEYIGMDHFAKSEDSLYLSQQSGTLHRNFQGYTTHKECDLLGLGVSAISKIGESYSQNYSALNDYYESLNSDSLPIKHGYKLDWDDALRRNIIMNIICHFELNIDDIENQYHIDFLDYFYNELIELSEMETDGLLTIDDKFITISPLGRFMVRNICLIFDKYNKNRGQNLSLFSKQI